MVNKGSGQEMKKSCFGTCSLAWHSGKGLCFKCQAGMQSCPSLFLPLAVGNASSGIVTSSICKIIVARSGVQLPVPHQITPHLLAALKFLLYPLYTLGETWQKVVCLKTSARFLVTLSHCMEHPLPTCIWRVSWSRITLIQSKVLTQKYT